MKRLPNTVAVIYSDGTAGSALTKSFAREVAKVFLTGRTLTKLKVIEVELSSNVGAIEIAQLDALDESFDLV